MSMRLKNVITGYILLLLIGIPSFVPALHELFHYHEHLHCTATASEVHLHASIYACDLCDFLTKTPYYSDAVLVLVTADVQLSSAEYPTAKRPYIQPLQGAHHLRGPPSLSI